MILSHSGSIPSAKILRNAILEELGWKKRQLLITSDNSKITGRLHLRFGNSSPVPIGDPKGVINSSKFIRFCSDKREVARYFSKHAEVPVPQFTKLKKKIPNKKDFPFLVRTTLTSSGSKGIMIFQEFKEFLEALKKGKIKYNSYWTPYYSFKEEFRVHILGGKIGKIFRKQLNDKDSISSIYIRNNDNSHFYRLALENTPESVINLVKIFHERMIKGFGKDFNYFTALDVGVVKDGSEAVLIEPNTAPGLNSRTAKIYAKYIIQNNPIFAESEEEQKVIKKLRESTKNMEIEWALEYDG